MTDPTTLPASTRIGCIGLGNMGLAMATNLQKHLISISAPPLAYHNRTMSRGEPLSALGATAYPSLADLVRDNDVIFLSLSDDAAITSTISNILTSHPTLTGKTIIDTTTIHPDTTSKIDTLLTAAGCTFIACPVFGGTPTAILGQLLLAPAGPSSAISLIHPYLVPLSRHILPPISSSPRDALVLKATGNLITACLADTLSTAHVFAEKAGLDAGVVGELVRVNYGSYAAGISDKLVSGRYAPDAEGTERPGSDVRLAVKDVGISVGMAEGLGMGTGRGGAMELGELVLRRLGRAREWGEREGRGLDSSAVYGVVREGAGLGFERGDVLEERRRREKEGEEREEEGEKR